MYNFSDRMKQALEIRHMSQADLSRKSGISTSKINCYIKGRYKAKQDTLYILSKALNVSEAWLMGYDVPIERFYSVPEITEDVIEFPVLCDITAGFDHVAYEDFSWEEKIKIPTDYIKGYDRQDFFVLRVTGDSMYPLYIAGDKVLIRRQSAVDSGAVAAVLYDGECATIKKVELSPGTVRLVPVNPLYQPQTITGADTERCTVLGIPVLLIRQFNDENNKGVVI